MKKDLLSGAKRLWLETEKWGESWMHEKPCKEWLQQEEIFGKGFCKHYAEARYKQFKGDIDSILPE